MFQPKTISVSWIDGNVDVDLTMENIIRLENTFGSLVDFATGLAKSPRLSLVADFYAKLLALGGKSVPVEEVYNLLFTDPETTKSIIENAAFAVSCMFPDQEETGAPKGQTGKAEKSRKATGKKSTK